MAKPTDEELEEKFNEMDNNVSGTVFIVDQVAFRCLGFLGTKTPIFECNVCAGLITHPNRHLRESNCDSRIIHNGPASDDLGESWRG